jgi:chorismate dehydratase
LGPVLDALQEAKRRGIDNIGPIAAREAPMLHLDAGFCRRYLANIIRFDLGPRELAGLQHYYQLASELGLTRHGVSVKLYEASVLSV